MNHAIPTMKPLSQLAPAGTPPYKCVLGLTGNLGAGKSVAAGCLKKYGAKVLTADEVGHKLLLSDSPVFEELLDTFGREILNDSGEIDRPKLAEIVFAEHSKLQELNQIVHPGIVKELNDRVNTFRTSDESGPLVIDAALIYEWEQESQFDGIIVIAAPVDVRRKRFVESRGFAGRNFDQREAAQLPQEEKVKRADVVFWNDDSIQKLEEQIRTFIQT